MKLNSALTLYRFAASKRPSRILPRPTRSDSKSPKNSEISRSGPARRSAVCCSTSYKSAQVEPRRSRSKGQRSGKFDHVYVSKGLLTNVRPDLYLKVGAPAGSPHTQATHWVYPTFIIMPANEPAWHRRTQTPHTMHRPPNKQLS